MSSSVTEREELLFVLNRYTIQQIYMWICFHRKGWNTEQGCQSAWFSCSRWCNVGKAKATSILISFVPITCTDLFYIVACL